MADAPATDVRERAVLVAAKVWRIARHTEVDGATYHRSCKALDEAVAVLVGALDDEPTPPPTDEELEQGRALVRHAKELSARLWAERDRG